MGWNQSAWRAAALSELPGKAGGRPDWHGLRARLSAAQAARRALAAAGDRIGFAGSFNSPAAGAVRSYGDDLGGVNPTDSAAGKPPERMDAGGAGASATGGRGVR